MKTVVPNSTYFRVRHTVIRLAKAYAAIIANTRSENRMLKVKVKYNFYNKSFSQIFKKQVKCVLHPIDQSL